MGSRLQRPLFFFFYRNFHPLAPACLILSDVPTYLPPCPTGQRLRPNVYSGPKNIFISVLFLVAGYC